MKKTLLALALVAGFSYGASAQCTPDTTHFTNTVKVYPASLPDIIVGQSFSGTVTLQVPDSLDANYFVSQIPAGYAKGYIDSIQITTISGMPTGITTATLPAQGTWLQHGQWSCTTFSGLVTTAPAGDYSLTISGTGCGHINYNGTAYSQCQAFNFNRVYPYKLTVAYPAGIQEVLNGVDLKVFPNPNQGSFTVNIAADDHLTGDLSVLDALGRTIHTEAIDVTGSRQLPVDLGTVASGVYILMIHTANGKAVKQFTVK